MLIAFGTTMQINAFITNFKIPEKQKKEHK